MAKPNSRKRRALRALEDLPGLFDTVDIDMSAVGDDREGGTGGQHRTADQPVGGATGDASFDISPESLHPRDQLMFVSFGSGSSGNCAYLGNAEGGILIDAGVDTDVVAEGLARHKIDMRNIAGILLTHDHGDHARSAYKLLRYNRHLLLYCTPRCLQGLLRRSSVSRRITDYHKPVYKEFEFEAGGFTITPFETSHDGSDNVGFAIRHKDKTFVVATDMGIITERADHYMRQANFLMLEADYDAEMLRRSNRPEYLKARIAGPTGHLENIVSGQWAASVLAENTDRPDILSHIFLCHLSQETNTPELALSTVRGAIEAKGITVGDATMSAEMSPERVQLAALPRLTSSPLYVLRRISSKKV